MQHFQAETMHACGAFKRGNDDRFDNKRAKCMPLRCLLLHTGVIALLILLILSLYHDWLRYEHKRGDGNLYWERKCYRIAF